jgi:hypothetical protein
MDKKTKLEGKKYSDNIIKDIERILNYSDDENRAEENQEEIINYGLSLSKTTIINYLISYGGPSYRIQIEVGQDSEILAIRPQYQDWYTKWVTMETTEEQDKILEQFVEVSYIVEHMTDADNIN